MSLSPLVALETCVQQWLFCGTWLAVWLHFELWFCFWRVAILCWSLYFVKQLQLHGSLSVLSVCISVGYSQCCYADWLEPHSDSLTVNPILRHRPGLLSQKETFTAEEKLSASLDPEGQLVRNSRCYTALCTNVDYSGCCYADRVEPQKTCWQS